MRSGLPLFSRRRSVGSLVPGRRSGDAGRFPVPPAYVAVAEALASGSSPVGPCVVVGRELASDGVSLGETLSALAATYAAVGAGAPDFAAVEALSVSWSEATLEFLHDVTCEDPLTGLASAPHLRTRLAEIYRGAAETGTTVRATHALVVVQVARRPGDDHETAVFGRALGLAAVADLVRSVFAGDETVARVGGDRVAALVRRSDTLGQSVATLRDRIERVQLPEAASVWIEGLPGQPDLGVRLLAELAL